MIHDDAKKLRNIPDGGGWRFVGRQQGRRNRAATTDKPRSKNREPKLGHALIHTVIDDHSRVVYAEIHDDETAVTAAAMLARAVQWFAARGGDTPAATPQKRSNAKHCAAGSITTITTDPTQPAGAFHPSHG